MDATARLHREVPLEFQELMLQPEAHRAADSAAAAMEDLECEQPGDAAHREFQRQRVESHPWAAAEAAADRREFALAGAPAEPVWPEWEYHAEPSEASTADPTTMADARAPNASERALAAPDVPREPHEPGQEPRRRQ